MYIETPYVLAVDDSPAKNLLRQVAVPSAKIHGTLTPFTAAKIQGWLFQPLGSTETILIVPPKTKPAKVPHNHARVIAATVTNGTEALVDVTEGTWLRHPQLGDGQPRKEAPTRIERSDRVLIETLREMSHTTRITMKIVVVQPGVSKAAMSEPQLRLLSVTENYLTETYQLAFKAIIKP